MNSRLKIESFLGTVAAFKELAPEELVRIARHTRTVDAARGQILFHRGDEASGIYLVVYGQVKLAFISPRGDERIVDVVHAGQSFGEAVVFTEARHIVTAQALVPSLLLYIPRDVVFEEIDRDPRFARRMIAGLARRLHHMMGDMEAQSMHSGTQRLIGFLLRDCEQDATVDGELRVTLPQTKGVVASRLNLTRERFSRILHDLTREGLIAVQGRTVRVRDPERLRAYEG